MGIMKETYNDYLLSKEESMELEEVEALAEKVALEPLEEDIDKLDEDMDEIPQHVIDEAKVDEAIMRRHDLRQMEMYDDPYMNWSGLR